MHEVADRGRGLITGRMEGDIVADARRAEGADHQAGVNRRRVGQRPAEAASDVDGERDDRIGLPVEARLLDQELDDHRLEKAEVDDVVDMAQHIVVAEPRRDRGPVTVGFARSHRIVLLAIVRSRTAPAVRTLRLRGLADADLPLQAAKLWWQIGIARTLEERVEAACVFNRLYPAGGDADAHIAPQRITEQRCALQVGEKAPLGLVVGVADVIADQHALARNRAPPAHRSCLPSSTKRKRGPRLQGPRERSC
ncbi:hypothetical protein DF3PB_1430009 [uncultured Defluviicoccus sp.]|uniref:Uncharacterized protein n=1 Tax=metagenome TaxID=256318 RepID=A0A380T994_9ZZZZ|nr:hypothetical protein DF3PB_1430009 [uncultured Defluviicoccus sp.]